MEEPTDRMGDGEIMGTLILNEDNIRNNSQLRRRTSSSSMRSNSGSPIRSVMENSRSRLESKSSLDSITFDEKEMIPDVVAGSMPLKTVSITPPRVETNISVTKTKATKSPSKSSDSYFLSLFTMCWVTEQSLSRSESSPSLVEGEAKLNSMRRSSRSSSRNSVNSSGGSLVDRDRVLSRENLKSLCKEREREVRENLITKLNHSEGSSLLKERIKVNEGSLMHENSSRSSRHDTMSETSTNVSLDTKKKKRRRKKKKKEGSDFTSTTESGDNERVLDVDDSISTVTNDTIIKDNCYLSTNENDSRYHNGSSQGDTDEEESEDIASEFVSIMEGGMTLLVITALGTTNSVIVTTDGVTLTWCLKRKQSQKKSISLDTICDVELGMPYKLRTHFTPQDQERSFCLVLSGGKSASFLAPTSLERDALAQGFDALIKKRLMMAQAIDMDFDLGLDIDEVHNENEKLKVRGINDYENKNKK